MKTCRDCGKEVSKSAKLCPNCGKKLKKPIGLFVFLGIIVIIIIGAVASSKKEEARQKVFEQDEVAIYKDVKYTITKVERNSGEKYFEPKKGKEYVLITLKIENESEEKISYNALDWKLQDGNGDEQSYAIWGSDNDTSLSSGDLNPNGIKTGTIAFEVETGDKNLVLKYYETFLDDERAFEFSIKD